MDISLDPDELEEGLDQQTLRARFEQQQSAQRNAQYADVSDVIAEETRKRQTKRKAGDKSDSKSKKTKDYKF